MFTWRCWRIFFCGWVNACWWEFVSSRWPWSFFVVLYYPKFVELLRVVAHETFSLVGSLHVLLLLTSCGYIILTDPWLFWMFLCFYHSLCHHWANPSLWINLRCDRYVSQFDRCFFVLPNVIMTLMESVVGCIAVVRLFSHASMWSMYHNYVSFNANFGRTW